MDAFKLTLSEASASIHSNTVSPTELLESLLQRIEQLERKLEAWVTLDVERAKATAEKYSKEAAEGRLRGTLHGIPIGIKDIFYTAGLKTTAGSKILADFIPSYDATSVAKLKEAGAIILGKTKTTQFAYSDPASTRNPWNIEHTPGGSSSGSAAAVSSGMCPAALGSQTGGSTIRPAAYCGIVGFKPTYGRISRHGVLPLSWSLDHVGILTRTVEDAAVLLEVLAGHDSLDASCSTLPVSSYRRTMVTLSPPRLGILRGYFYENANDEVKANFEKVVEKLGNSGAEVAEARLPKSFSTVHAAHKILMATEAAAYHNEIFQKRMNDYRPKLRGLIATGLLVSASTYLKAERIRVQFTYDIASGLKEFDCFLMPSTATPAPKGLESTGDMAFNAPWSFCGFPSITVPSGLTKDQLPLGIQLVGRAFDEETLLRAAYWCEKTLGIGREPHDPK